VFANLPRNTHKVLILSPDIQISFISLVSQRKTININAFSIVHQTHLQLDHRLRTFMTFPKAFKAL